VGGLVQSLDANHLVSLGTIEGACGSNGPDYSYIYSGSSMDIADYHDYHGTSTDIPGDSYNGLGVNITRVHTAGKVIFVGESGIDWIALGITRQQRADAFQSKITAQETAGTSGLLMWTWGGYSATTDPSRALEIPFGDPSLTVIANN